MSAKRVLLTTAAGLVLASSAAFAAVIVMEKSSARADDMASQAQEISALTAKNASLTERLDRCLDATDTYKGYIVESQDMLLSVQEKWGKNYMTPIESTVEIFQTASDQLNCY